MSEIGMQISETCDQCNFLQNKLTDSNCFYCLMLCALLYYTVTFLQCLNLPWVVHTYGKALCLLVNMFESVPSSLRFGLNFVLFLVAILKTRSSSALECAGTR